MVCSKVLPRGHMSEVELVNKLWLTKYKQGREWILKKLTFKIQDLKRDVQQNPAWSSKVKSALQTLTLICRMVQDSLEFLWTNSATYPVHLNLCWGMVEGNILQEGQGSKVELVLKWTAGWKTIPWPNVRLWATCKNFKSGTASGWDIFQTLQPFQSH